MFKGSAKDYEEDTEVPYTDSIISLILRVGIVNAEGFAFVYQATSTTSALCQ